MADEVIGYGDQSDAVSPELKTSADTRPVPKKRKPVSRKKIIFLIVFLMIAIGAGTYYVLHMNEQSTDDAAVDAHVVTISPKVGGYVQTLNVQDNQIVKAGDTLVEVDPTDYQIRRDKAAASLEAAKASYEASAQNVAVTKVSAPSNLETAQANVVAAEANWRKAALDLKRQKSLTDEERSRSQLENAVATEAEARSLIALAKAKARSAETAPQTVLQAQASADQLTAQVKQAEAELAQAEKDLADSKIVSPIDGRVTDRTVERGNYVQPGQQLFSVVSNDVWITANFKETQLKHMKQGQPVDIHVDAFPDLKLTGKVDSIQAGTGARFSVFPAENATGNFVKIVQRVPVKIVLDQPNTQNQNILGAGLSTVVTVHTN